MASSANFLERALSTEVREKAVGVVVGSLENQLVTSENTVFCQQVSASSGIRFQVIPQVLNGTTVSVQKHGTIQRLNSMNIVLSTDTNKNSSDGNTITQVVSSTNLPTVVSSSYLTPSSSVGLLQPNIASLAKTQDGLKVVYPATQINAVTKTYSVQSVSNSLPNGNVNITLPNNNVLNTTSSNVSNMVSQPMPQTSTNVHKVVTVGSDKPGTATLVIKSNNIQGTNAASSSTSTAVVSTSSGQMNAVVPSSSTGLVTVTKPITSLVNASSGGNSAQILPNVQIVNVSSVRSIAPSQQVNKTTTPRLVIPQMIRSQTGQPVTLQSLQGLQNIPGHVLLKTENGQLQLLRVGPISQASTGVNNATTIPAASFKVQTFPVANVSTSGTSSTTVTTSTQSASPQGQKDNTKEKCRKFLANLLELSSREPKAVEKNVRTLIQELVDAKVEPEEFCDRLEKLLNASPQPCLIGFLKKSLPLLRVALSTKEMTIDGIRPPSLSAASVTSVVASPTQTLQNAQQVRPTQLNQMKMVHQPALNSSVRSVVGQAPRIVTPVRVQTSSIISGTAASKVVQSQTLAQSTLPSSVTNIRMQSSPTTKFATLASSSISTSATSECVLSTSTGTSASVPSTSTGLRQTFRQPVRPVTGKTVVNMASVRTPNALTQKGGNSSTKNNLIKQPSIVTSKISTAQQKSGGKEKEKKGAFSSPGSSAAGFVPDDDVNDVAAMAGVNLAEETQRILGSTEFVGTQIRSCKDEIFLPFQPLVRRIISRSAKHGLAEPHPDVVALISHAVQERMKNVAEKLSVIVEHRTDFNKADDRYEVLHDIRGQLKLLEEMDKLEKRRHDEMEREVLIRAAKSRSKSEDPEQVKLKAKAKEMQRAEMEEMRQKEANVTALLAIGPRKKLKTEADSNPQSTLSSGVTNSGTNNPIASRTQVASRPRIKRVTLRDFLFLLEQEKETTHSTLLYKAMLK